MMSSLHKCLIFVWNGEVQWCREGLPWVCQWDNWPGILKKCSIWGNPYSQAFEYILTRTPCTQASDTCFSAGRSSSWGCKSMCVLCTSADWSCSSTQLPEARYILPLFLNWSYSKTYSTLQAHLQWQVALSQSHRNCWMISASWSHQNLLFVSM